jgi:cyclopropane fatty-acyl-phospholipid synthase-like methyltransferase
VNLDETERRWERLAREDAEFYIWTDPIPGDDFFASGVRDAERILAFAGPHIRAWDAALEMGCGIGRITLPMAAKFGSVTAVDIAPTMLARLAAHCGARGVSNVRPMLVRDGWEQAPAGFAYSRIVFQHIADWSIIAEYFRRISAALTPGGAFYVQLDTRPASLTYRLRNALPDALLPRTWRRGVRRIRRSRGQIVECASANGLTLAAERGAGTADHEFVFVAVSS